MHTVMSRPATCETISEAVDKAFALFPLAIKGKKVLIKPFAARRSARKRRWPCSERVSAIRVHPGGKVAAAGFQQIAPENDGMGAGF